ncbi:transcriptional regulator [Paenibacillus sp. B01]|uniref:transcriptional regulator n=1 Tax=Paenibacillus sp. B01 TaxID=2660554 RepID=UPI00129A7AA4|nr:transcriptional regulator [Paenibacillus sp. B01]QGG55976.1 transcriptional regulator [Paenibacillus sp. B01]
MPNFQTAYDEWLQAEIQDETNPRRRELLEKGLGHGTVAFLKQIWFPTMRSFKHLHPEWEVRDASNGYRYVDLAYLPGGGAKGGIEIQGFGPHARDLDVRRFKDLSWRYSMLSIDDWLFIPVAYLSIVEEPKRCQQLVLSFVGKFIAGESAGSLTALEAETVRYARRVFRPFTPSELTVHLNVSAAYARRILHRLVELGRLKQVGGNLRYRSYALPDWRPLPGSDG